jgi:hypothetical protein
MLSIGIDNRFHIVIPHSYIESNIALRVRPYSLKEYSTFGGTTGKLQDELLNSTSSAAGSPHILGLYPVLGF